jgi:hypothetical protein
MSKYDLMIRKIMKIFDDAIIDCAGIYNARELAERIAKIGRKS